MAQQKKQKQSPDSNIVVGTLKTKSKFSKYAKKPLAILISLASIAALFWYYYYVYSHNKPHTYSKDCQTHINTLAKLVEQKNYAVVPELADQYLKKDCTNEQKVSILDQKGLSLLFQNKTEEAEAVFKQVEPLNGGKYDVASAQSLATINYKRGDKEAAIKYYKALIEAFKATPSNDDDGYIPQYESIIKSLGGTP